MIRKDPHSRAFRERGAATVIFALLLPVLFGSVALAVDFGRLVYERQHLSNALDAAALAGAASLPSDPTAARNAAVAFAKANDPAADPTASFWCVVASSGAAKTVLSGQIPSVCDPGPVTGAKCSETICAIPCTPAAGLACNTITVTAAKDVPFAFAPAIGINTGNTGSLASDACKGSCGAQTPNPMDVAIIADRTSSMSTDDLTNLKAAIQTTLKTMTKDQQYVALGTIGRSSDTPSAACITDPSGSATSGPWIPVPFSNDYTTTGAPPALNNASPLVQGVQCLQHSGTGTYLASPMKAAARYLLGLDANNLRDLPPRSGTPRKAIVLETDGQPNETGIAGVTDVGTPGDIKNSDGVIACNNLKAVAADAKARRILIVTVGYNLSLARCGGTGEFVRDVLAAAASDKAPGVPSTAGNDCSSPALIAAENSDGDYFFCAASGTDLGPIFVSAINAISPNSRLVRIPS
ncbi:pilus assembly protein TadG-related protein [Pseudarthrobacter albicanus]|uniref:pilus assembly protein TadG-related protein n=1 Tax=Pseudarthrobacter albicanus TaxID=2823873 RepID=UPI001BA69552|nr:pilus assembly protein TadG-related protein [Pseudarthrobacter albicanus]